MKGVSVKNSTARECRSIALLPLALSAKSAKAGKATYPRLAIARQKPHSAGISDKSMLPHPKAPLFPRRNIHGHVLLAAPAIEARNGFVEWQRLCRWSPLAEFVGHSEAGRVHRWQLMCSTMPAHMACSTVSTGPR
jgi:hypothetical protein